MVPFDKQLPLPQLQPLANSLCTDKILWGLPFCAYLMSFPTVFFEFIYHDAKDKSAISKTEEYIVYTYPSFITHSHVIETCLDSPACLL